MDNKKKGLMYVATGERHLNEAYRSARSAKSFMPTIQIAIFTNYPPEQIDQQIFDYIYTIKDPTYSYSDKISPLSQTPFEKTLFIDTDTVFIDNISEIFELLDKFDLLYCHEDTRRNPRENRGIKEIPECFTEANTGVLAYNNCDQFTKLIRHWKRAYSKQISQDPLFKVNQPTFKKALYNSEIKTYILPPEYNMRTVHPMFKGGNMNAKILHGRGITLDRAISNIKPSPSSAIYDFRVYDFRYEVQIFIHGKSTFLRIPLLWQSAKKLFVRLRTILTWR